MIRIGASTIHGTGLFARIFIPKGTVIGQIEGDWVEEDGPCVLWINEHQGICVTNDLRFINHSSNPNVAYYDDMTVSTLRNIEADEEITHDYMGDGQFEGEVDFAA